MSDCEYEDIMDMIKDDAQWIAEPLREGKQVRLSIKNKTLHYEQIEEN